MAAPTPFIKKINPYTLPLFDYGTIPDPAVAERAQAAVARIQELQHGTVIEIGRELIKVKEELEYGTFINWLEAFGMERRSASNYMAAATAFGDRWEMVSHLPANVLYKLASPKILPEVREAAFNLKPGQSIKIGDIEIATREAKKTRVRKERSTKEAKAIRAENNAKHEAEMRREQAEREAERIKAYEAADKVRDMLGDRFDEFCGLMVGVNSWKFQEALEKHIRHNRSCRNLVGGSPRHATPRHATPRHATPRTHRDLRKNLALELVPSAGQSALRRSIGARPNGTFHGINNPVSLKSYLTFGTQMLACLRA